MKPGKPEVVVVTGASAGIGRTIVRAFAHRGASIGLLARGRDGLEAARHEVEEAGGKALVIPTDVADPAQVESAAAQVEEAFGPIDLWINDAVALVFSPVKEMTAEEYRRVTEVSYLGYVYGTLTALRRMLPRDHGKIIQIGSGLAYRGVPLLSSYSAAKHAIEGFTESLRTELLHDKSHVRLTIIQPSGVNTPLYRWGKSRLPQKMHPFPPIYQPEVVARAATWAADHDRRALSVGIGTLLVLVGNRLVPGFVDWYLSKTGYNTQQTDEPADPSRPFNLWTPVDDHDGDGKDRGTRGDLTSHVYQHSSQLWATIHRRSLTLLGTGLLAGLACLTFFKRKR